MRLNLNTFRRAPSLRVLLASTVMLALGVSLLMAVSLSLHKALHADAGDASHQCVATLLSRDHLLTADRAPVVFAPVSGLALPPLGEERPAPAVLEILDSPPRAPPVCS